MFPLLIDFGTYDLPLVGETHLFLPTYGVLFAFRKIEHNLSGHLRARDDEREQAATEALAVR